MGWQKVAEPELRPKGHPEPKPNLDSKIRGFGGLTTVDVGEVRMDFANHTAWVWFQDIGWQAIRFGNVDIVDYDPFLHLQNGAPRLKLWLAEFPSSNGGHPNTTILDTGYEYR